VGRGYLYGYLFEGPNVAAAGAHLDASARKRSTSSRRKTRRPDRPGVSFRDGRRPSLPHRHTVRTVTRSSRAVSRRSTPTGDREYSPHTPVPTAQCPHPSYRVRPLPSSSRGVHAWHRSGGLLHGAVSAQCRAAAFALARFARAPTVRVVDAPTSCISFR
jgi:hypothetical protein